MPNIKKGRPDLFTSSGQRDAFGRYLETEGLGTKEQIATVTERDYAAHDWISMDLLMFPEDQEGNEIESHVRVTWCQDCGLAVMGDAVPRKGMVMGSFVLPEEPPECSGEWEDCGLRFEW